jgi:3-dehydroquinate dehydratase-2
MTKVLVVQGAGMNMRGKVQIELFGQATLDETNDQIGRYAESLGVQVEFFHSNILGEVLNALYDAHDRDVDAVVINPAGFTTGAGPLPSAIAQVRYPVIEVHASNPTSRGIVSAVLPACRGSVYGFGVYGYYLALEAAKQLTLPA